MTECTCLGPTHRLLLSLKGGVGLAVTPQPYATPVQFVIIGVCLGCYNELESPLFSRLWSSL